MTSNCKMRLLYERSYDFKQSVETMILRPEIQIKKVVFDAREEEIAVRESWEALQKFLLNCPQGEILIAPDPMQHMIPMSPGDLIALKAALISLRDENEKLKLKLKRKRKRK